MFSVPANFIANFKIGDNINKNLATVRLLYELCDEDPARGQRLRKPITVALVSIAEAMLYDFIRRIQSNEAVPSISSEVVLALKGKNLTEFTHFIVHARKHKLFGENPAFYERGDELRKLRNRIHIQNEKEQFQRDEDKAFTLARQKNAEEIVEYISKYLLKNHSRSKSTHGFVGDLVFPWQEIFE